MVQHLPGALFKYSEDFIDLFTSKYYALEDRILWVDQNINKSEDIHSNLSEANLKLHDESMAEGEQSNSEQTSVKNEEFIK